MSVGLNDWVFWGSVGSVVIAVVIIVFLAWKVTKLMNSSHSED